jgi:hypothetical protein
VELIALGVAVVSSVDANELLLSVGGLLASMLSLWNCGDTDVDRNLVLESGLLMLK